MNIFEEVEGLVSNKFSVMKSLFSLIKSEAKLAGLSFLPFMMTGFTLFIVILTSWSSALVFTGYCINLFVQNSLISILLVLILNLAVLLILLKYLILNLKQMSFEKTRAYFTGNKDEECQKRFVGKDRIDEQSLESPGENGKVS